MLRIVFLVIVALIVTLPVHAKPNKANQHGAKDKINSEQGTAVAGKTFGPAERNLIRSHLLGGKKSSSKKSHEKLPSGLQKKVARGKQLPPGWQKRVAPGKSLDYQVYRQGENLPDSLLQQLPPSPIGSEIIRVEDMVIRLNSATRTILDVFNLIPAG
jgi:hypothetical protein